jgi:hypothetical protein
MSCSILLSGFIGLGNIFAGRQDLLPVMKLDLTLRGCPCTNGNGTTGYCTDFLEPEDYWELDLPDNSHWKDTHSDDSFFIKVWSTSYSKTIIHNTQLKYIFNCPLQFGYRVLEE